MSFCLAESSMTTCYRRHNLLDVTPNGHEKVCSVSYNGLNMWMIINGCRSKWCIYQPEVESRDVPRRCQQALT